MPIEHRHPTPNTRNHVLAACGNQCAFESCSNPIFSGEHRSLIGNICHIKARQEGGPRFDYAQSEEENRSFANLLALCKIHAHIVDEKHLSEFTVDRLTSMKQQHEERVEQRGDRSWIKPSNMFQGPMDDLENKDLILTTHFWNDRTGRVQIYSPRQLATCNHLQKLYLNLCAIAGTRQLAEQNPEAKCKDILKQEPLERGEQSVIADIILAMAETPDISFAEFGAFLVAGNDPTELFKHAAIEFEKKVGQTEPVRFHLIERTGPSEV